jgi:ABC-type polysaccharide/polyol phosphate transport system ATPase subunit
MTKVIKVENLSKAYRLGEIGTGTIAKDLDRFWARMRGKEDPFLKIGEANDRSVKGGSDVVLSLNDINFEIEQGDAVGIIGRNGAGKSTLLKILSRVTAPTTGSVKVKGRIASLLEVGTGFHPELTGKENIFLNGAILGMRKAEIKRKFDEIVDFSGIERYIDTPVKRYSSGMYVRLAFAVAAYLESEILIVDEVLAVGDAEFQKKCLGKMDDVSKGEGRTILFVSHNMGAISTLCKSGIYLENGRMKAHDKIDKIIHLYNDSHLIKNKHSIDITSYVNNAANQWVHKSTLDLKISWERNKFENGCYCDISFHTSTGVKLFSLQSHRLMNGKKISAEYNSITFKIENIGFVARDLRIDVGFKEDLLHQYSLLIEDAYKISIPKNENNNYTESIDIVSPNVEIQLL